ncbi:hypothetical protein ACLKA6_002212 [Drosophila palustris]
MKESSNTFSTHTHATPMGSTSCSFLLRRNINSLQICKITLTFKAVERRLQRDRKQHKVSLCESKDLGHMRELHQKKSTLGDNYLPHHPVNPEATGIFTGRLRINGLALNDALHTDHDQQTC